jgi:opacity protein-like surface antigen
VFKKTCIALSLLALPLTASADWLVGGGYGNISDDEDGIDLSLGVIYGSIAYEFSNENSPFIIMPELRLGTGISDDSFAGVDIEVNSFTALSVRGQYNYDNGVYLFAMPSYANLDVEASFGGHSESDDSWEFGFGGGVGAQINEKLDIEASYESYDGTDVLSVGLKYAF